MDTESRTSEAVGRSGGVLAGLNPEQRRAVLHGLGPLLVVAGAGTGKTRTLVHRVAYLIEQGADPGRLLLLTFTRRAAAEMLRRVEPLVGRHRHGIDRKVWGGTFHGVASRLLRLHGPRIGLDASFTVQDRADSEDLLDIVRTELGLAETDKRFPKKGTCLAVYSHSVNSQRPLAELLADHFPWCADYAVELKRLFQGYVDRKEAARVLDYDDLLLFWHALLEDARAGREIRGRFDCVLVDEYQDTNLLQARIIQGLRPDGEGLTVVGDDAQSIYAFRAATVRNILDFPSQFPGTTIVKLEQNYRSTPPLLEVANQVIAEGGERFEKRLWSTRTPGARPNLVACVDEEEQATYVASRVLQLREEGLALREQAVLFRASHHSIVLEAELARRNVPFVKYGGLKFLEAAHVKDLLAFLRLAENPRDVMAGSRALKLLPGIGPRRASDLLRQLTDAGGEFTCWDRCSCPPETATIWPLFVQTMLRIRTIPDDRLVEQVAIARAFYAPILADRYDHAEPRERDLEQLQQLASRYPGRQAMLAELTLDPPASTADFADEPLLDEDYLILSTIHSAKGLEWKAVFVIHASDGNIPSDMATKDKRQIEEERRLFYVALSRARDYLHICCPQRYYHVPRGPRADRHGMAQNSRFLSPKVMEKLEPITASRAESPDSPVPPASINSAAIRDKLKALW